MNRLLLHRGATEMGIRLAETAVAGLEIYYNLILEENKQQNLTRITSEEDIIILHFLDSFALRAFDLLKGDETVLDLGSGMGIPGIPLKLVYPEISLSLLETSRKKSSFLRKAVMKIGLSDTDVLVGRAEELGRCQEYRQVYDCVVSRAVAKMPVLLELTLPFVKPGGVLFAYKGPEGEREMSRAKKVAFKLGGKPGRVFTFSLPMRRRERSVIEVIKVGNTPAEYPRRPGIPEKRPLKGNNMSLSK